MTHDSSGSSYRWVILALALSAFIMAFVSRFAWPPLIPVIGPVLHLSFTQTMAYMSAFYIGYVIMQIPGGILADYFGPRLVLVCALFLQGMGTLGMSFIENYETGFILRIVCGLGAGCVFSSCMKAVVTWFSPVQRGLAIGVVMTAPTIGIAVPNFAMPVLESSMGWRGAFRGIGGCIILLAVLLVLFMKDRKTLSAGRRKSFMTGLRFVMRNRTMLLIFLIGFSGVWAQIGFGSVANSYMAGFLNMSVSDAGRVMMMYGIIGIPVSALAGWFSGRNPSKKKRMVVMCHVLMSAAFFVFGQSGGYAGILLTACAIGFLIACVNALCSLMIADSAGPEWAATAGGVGNCIFQIGALVSPLAIGLARDAAGHYAWTWWILGIGALLGAFAAAFIKGGESPK
jgi:predicted MFS family arabinose efflux permease